MGDIFLRALKMVIIPLILSSIISGVTSMGEGKNLGRLGFKTLLYYLGTSTLAILTGLIIVNVVKPGVGVELGFSQSVEGLAEKAGSVKDILYRLVPDNIVDAMAQGTILSVIFFAIVFGYFITKVDEPYKGSLKTFFDAIFEVMMKVTLFIIKFTPLGIFGIVAGEVARNSEQLANIAGSLAIYSLCVIVGLLIHSAYNSTINCTFYRESKTICTLKKYGHSPPYGIFNIVVECNTAINYGSAGTQQRRIE